MVAVAADQNFDLNLTSGRIRVRRIGSSTAPLVLFVHGLSAHLHAFDFIVERLAAPDRQLVALDLRGRGRSEITPLGTYGLDAHCSDVLEVVTRLGADRFDLVGWSMGAMIGICAADRAPERLRRLVLIDGAGGNVDPGALDRVIKGLARLDMVVEQPSAYIEAVRTASGISPWTPFWDLYFEYELSSQGSGFKATTSKSACLEDAADILSHDWPVLWKGLTMPVLLVRCLLPIGGGFVVPEAIRDELRGAVRQIKIAEVASDHFTVMTSESASNAIKEFLSL